MESWLFHSLLFVTQSHKDRNNSTAISLGSYRDLLAGMLKEATVSGMPLSRNATDPSSLIEPGTLHFLVDAHIRGIGTIDAQTLK